MFRVVTRLWDTSRQGVLHHTSEQDSTSCHIPKTERFMPWLATRRSVNISRAAVKLPGAMVWGHGSSSAPEWHGFSRIDEVSSDHFQRQRMWWVSFQETHLLFDCDTATGAIVSLHLLEKPMLQKWEKAVKSWLGSGHGSKLLSHLTSLYPNQSRTIPPAPLQRRRTWLGDYKYVQPNWHASAAVKLLSSCASGVWGEIAHRYCKSDACTKNQAADLRVPTLQYIILNYIYIYIARSCPPHGFSIHSKDYTWGVEAGLDSSSSKENKTLISLSIRHSNLKILNVRLAWSNVWLHARRTF